MSSDLGKYRINPPLSLELSSRVASERSDPKSFSTRCSIESRFIGGSGNACRALLESHTTGCIPCVEPSCFTIFFSGTATSSSSSRLETSTSSLCFFSVFLFLFRLSSSFFSFVLEAFIDSSCLGVSFNLFFLGDGVFLWFALLFTDSLERLVFVFTDLAASAASWLSCLCAELSPFAAGPCALLEPERKPTTYIMFSPDKARGLPNGSKQPSCDNNSFKTLYTLQFSSFKPISSHFFFTSSCNSFSSVTLQFLRITFVILLVAAAAPSGLLSLSTNPRLSKINPWNPPKI
mmetsp:Transcript_34289/g.54924  ORF Transcript_34289/g.54924 Transcript_34289/m.54924 type:complete len:291 (+) Transcript_34289:5450-6322(+)